MKSAIIFLFILSFGLIFAPFIHAKKTPGKEILTYVGRYFKDPLSPDYSSYDREMSIYIVKQIKSKYNVDLDHTSYSAFDLLEIEALLKCKKSDESVESLLKRFQK
ncbi:MAG: hypothetical protein JSW70_05540 [Syntrophobacterales bacterium]|nr:MAG: hypothetical protein JSW70_05540 [Syntrophobacterales bacterium]